VERARWNTGGSMLARGEIPQSVCSLPCGLGEIKSFEVR
jgi:hypothetical protein